MHSPTFKSEDCNYYNTSIRVMVFCKVANCNNSPAFQVKLRIRWCHQPTTTRTLGNYQPTTPRTTRAILADSYSHSWYWNVVSMLSEMERSCVAVWGWLIMNPLRERWPLCGSYWKCATHDGPVWSTYRHLVEHLTDLGTAQTDHLWSTYLICEQHILEMCSTYQKYILHIECVWG